MVPSGVLLLALGQGAPSSVLAPKSDALCPMVPWADLGPKETLPATPLSASHGFGTTTIACCLEQFPNILVLVSHRK